MSDGSKIEWLARSGTRPATWNPVTGCTKISEGCAHCYAERMSKRLRGRFGYPEDEPFRVTLHPDRLDEPLRWKKPRTVFVCSMGDLFHENVSFEHVSQIATIMQKAQHHTFLCLTKRADRMLEWLVWSGFSSRTLPNLWLGVTAENQRRADERIPLLLQCPAAVRFVSVEPMLGPVYLADALAGYPRQYGPDQWEQQLPPLDWVIVGGETGPGARPMHPDWVRGVRDQCVASGVPFFFKKHGAYLHQSQGGVTLPAHLWMDGFYSSKVSSKHSSHLLDGQEWHQWPQ